jgi:hypothetical protein
MSQPFGESIRWPKNLNPLTNVKGMRTTFLSVVLWTASMHAGSLAVSQQPAVQTAAAPADAPEPWPAPEAMAERRVSAEQRPLFASKEPVSFTLMADFGAVQRDRNPESTKLFPATLVVAHADGSEASIPMQIRTRGHSRRKPDFCTFAPLRLQFETNPVGTVFEGQRALKLGTHCRDLGDYEQYVLREYAVYEMFNVLTHRSFRARLGKARYVDARSKREVASRMSLFLEDDDDVARRLEGRASDQLKVSFRRTHSDTLTLMTLFEYMIGNTDMSILALHNVRLVRTPDETFYPIPYDFDYSGVVNARYAVPDPRLHISSVRDRVYRGPCRTHEQFEATFAHLRTSREKLFAVYDQVPGLKTGYIRQAKSYLEQFFRTIDEPGRVKRAFIDGCDGRAGM